MSSVTEESEVVSVREKVDFKKSMDSYRATHGEFRFLDVPPRQFLMVDGQGDPNTSQLFTDALEALYPVAYKLKFASKLELERDYVVPPLETLWWGDDASVFTIKRDKSRWNWTVMLLVPEWITEDMYTEARSKAGSKHRPVRLDDVRLETFDEGHCVQTLHLGSFDSEGPTLEEMHHRVIPRHGFRMTGVHHEIYFSDFRKVDASKLSTILRQAVVPQ